jgi:hypothetical protein
MFFRFLPPTDDEVESEDPAVVADAILHEGAEYWNDGAGGGVVEMGPEFDPLQLHIYHDGQERFQMRYNPREGAPLIARTSSHGGKDAVINVGGDPFTLAADSLLPREGAARIARHFCETGEPDPDFEWR